MALPRSLSMSLLSFTCSGVPVKITLSHRHIVQPMKTSVKYPFFLCLALKL